MPSDILETVSTTHRANHRRSFLLVVCCTLIGAAAQIFIKRGAGSLGANPSMVQAALAMVLNPALLTGFSLYGISMVLLVLALRHGELSLLYPVFALTYVWVAILSVVMLHESMNALKLAGIATIVAGIAVLGRGQQST
jgi:drug/metabolite transporter (DMT)-like permease